MKLAKILPNTRSNYGTQLLTHLQDVMPIIMQRELEHGFVHIIDEVSGHLIEIMEAEERGATNEDEGTDEILVWEMGMRHDNYVVV